MANLVNADMDAPAKELGPGHRVVRHDTAYALDLARRYGPQAFLAAQLHIALDNASRDPALRRAFAVMEAFL